MKNEKATNVFNSADRVSIRLVEQLADAEGLDPRDLPPLGQAIDLEALDTLIESTTSTLTVTFSVNGYDALVTSKGSVVLDSGTNRKSSTD